MKHNVFISYHHANDQECKEELVIRFGETNGLFIDKSVNTGDIGERLTDEQIREKIRDYYLKDSTVTILLVGSETKHRKHVDWELYSSMYDGAINKKSGILCINLPSIQNSTKLIAAHCEEKKFYPEQEWASISKERTKCKKAHPYLPDRIIDNLLKNVPISVTNWDDIVNNTNLLKFLLDKTFENRANCDYDLSSSMRRQNSSNSIFGS